MSKGKKILLFFAFFVFLPGFIAFVTENPESRNQINVEPKTPAPEPSQNSCFDIRAEKSRLEQATDKNSEDALNEINRLQKKFLLKELQELSGRGLISSKEFSQIEDISEGTLQERLDSLAENFIDVSATLDRLIKQKNLSPYFNEEVVALGEQLAAPSNPTFAFILANRTCFDDLDIWMAESFTSIDAKSIESNWGKKKSGADFALVLTRG